MIVVYAHARYVQYTSTCLHLLLTRPTFSFLFSPSIYLPFVCSVFFSLILKSMTIYTAVTQAQKIGFKRAFIKQLMSCFCVYAAIKYRCIQNSSSLVLVLVWLFQTVDSTEIQVNVFTHANERQAMYVLNKMIL